MHALASPTTVMRATTVSPGALTRPPRWLALLVLAYAHLAQLSFLGTLAAGLELGGPYAWVRHPMITATLAFLWITPHMSLGHLVLALGFTAYALIGTALEERSLLQLYGDAYARYQRLVPRPWRAPSRRTAP